MNTVFEYYPSISYGRSIILNNTSNYRIHDIIIDIDANLQSFPDTILVEVGIFRIQDTTI